MPRPFQRARAALALWVTITLVVPVSGVCQPVAASSSIVVPPSEQGRALQLTETITTGLVRTRITVEDAYAQRRLESLDVRQLDAGEGWALVLVDTTQMEILARLGYRLEGSDDLGTLLKGNEAAHPTLFRDLRPLVEQASEAVSRNRADSVTAAAVVDLAPLVASITEAQAAEIAQLLAIDDDADGLTNTQEEWWCTDPLNADSDADGVSDAAEVAALKAWLRNETASFPASGKPFNGWPSDHIGCWDDDKDSVPDMAEQWDLGLNRYRESTDRDKFDDGQELFGLTHCTGEGGYCSYGTLPRDADWGVVFAEMPSWVEAPGNHPLVAAFPMPKVSVIASSLNVETVVQVTTDHLISTGTETSYSTASLSGMATGTTETTTWNDWQEVSDYSYAPSSAMSVAHAESTVGTTIGAVLAGVEFAGTAIGIAADAKELLAKPPTLKDFLGFAIRPGEDNCLILEEDQERNVNLNNLDVDHVQLGFDVNLYCSDSSGLTTGCSSGNGYGLSGSSDGLYKTWEFAAQRPNLISQDNLTFGGDGQLLINGSDPFTEQHTLCFGQTQAIHVSVASPGAPMPRIAQVSSVGHEQGGAFSTSHTAYEEHTVTNGEAFSSEESWGTATAVNSAHAADLWFTYQVTNDGTEYAREVSHLAFNIYIGDDTNPACTYFVGSTACGVPVDTVLFTDFRPGESHQYTSYRIPLSLDQMKAIDLGGPVRIEMEDYSFGSIDNALYSEAISAGVRLTIEDGTDDGDETIDTYVIPTWGTETVLDVAARYFPHTVDEQGTLTAIWTPEYRSDTPVWCDQPRRTGGTLWCRHALSTADWWNIYTNGMGDGTEGFQDTLAAGGSTALFRFNKDSDLDGYSDRSEDRLGTNPTDASSYPRPEVVAGVHSIRSGSGVTATLSLLNTGLYDAYGVEAVMIAPDDSVTILNNTVGGSGRVPAQQEVVVGSRILPPFYSVTTWGGTAEPFTAGYYTGSPDRVYTFTALHTGEIGVETRQLSWSDGRGASGVLNFGTGYASPTPLSVGSLGLKVGLISGNIRAGDVFTVAARTPRDTFQYIINREPCTAPVVLVSYNDPQGNHRFVIPPAAMSLTTPTANLVPYAGQMLQDPGVEIVSTEAYAIGLNSVNLVVNNPTGVTLTNAHLFLEFVNITGTVASEVPVTVTVPSGLTVVPVVWNTAAFSPTFQVDEDYIVMAFWTDHEGNILDTAARPLSSFAEDPTAALSVVPEETTWNFGTVPQGTALKHPFVAANTGRGDLLTYVDAPLGLTLSQTGSRRIGTADMTTYEITLDTTGLPIGAYSNSITIRSSDPDSPSTTVLVSGSITTGAADMPVGAMQRPMDVSVSLASGTLGQWVQYTHTLGPTPQTLHPAMVYNQTYTTLYGVGKYATAFGAGTASYDMFGDGRDGDLQVASGTVLTINTTMATVNASGSAATVSTSAGFAVGDVVLLHQTQGTANTGRWELAVIASISGTTWSFREPLSYTYSSMSAKAQVVRVPQYRNVTVAGTLTAPAWNGSMGGILAFAANSVVAVSGAINMDAKGFRAITTNVGAVGHQGEGYAGVGSASSSANGNGGGGGNDCEPGWNCSYDSGGGGGGNGTAGFLGQSGGGNAPGGQGGSVAGTSDLQVMVFGGAGGQNGDADNYQASGGVGGGIVLAWGREWLQSGAVRANGGTPPARADDANAGGGAGGSILIRTEHAALGTLTSAVGGSGGAAKHCNGGNGGMGRVRVEYCNSLSGSTSPPATTQQLSCYIAEQIETSPYTSGRLNLPETFTTARTYQIQYAWRHVFAAAGEQTSVLRVPAGAFADVRLDALISGVGIGTRTFWLDIGDDGSWDWEWTGSVTNAIALNSANLSYAFSRYWATHGAPTSGDVDVPVRVYLSQAGQVLLNNLRVTRTGSRVRYAQLPVHTYSAVSLALRVDDNGSGLLVLAADVGDNGSIDWTYTGSVAFPATITTSNLAAAFNAYLAGHSGDVTVPIRFYVTPFTSVRLTNFSATPSALPDATLGTGDITFGVSTPTEGAVVPVTAEIHNSGAGTSEPLVAAFFATLPDWGEWYIGSALAPSIPTGGTAQATIQWNTMGYTGTVPVRVRLDPYNRLAEANEANNEATTTFRILTRPDLYASSVEFSDVEPMAGETVTVTLGLRNAGETTAGPTTVGFEVGDALLSSAPVATLGAGAETTTPFTWTPAAPGPHRLRWTSDRAGAVNEYDENNNVMWRDVYVGFPSPLLLDSGVPASDPAYLSGTGYGVVDTGLPDVLATCGAGAAPYETLRRDPEGRLTYRFDHLLPGHFYHLDITLYECDGAGRQESVYVDGTLVAGPEDLGDGEVHQLSIRLDPALYRSDHEVEVVISAPGFDGAVVSEVNLHDIDYRYADAGAASDQSYVGSTAELSFGWLDGTALTTFGTLPYQSVRADQDDNELRYQFSGLAADTSYNVHFTFWQPSGTARIERIRIDGLGTGVTVNTGDFALHHETVSVPPAAYADDGTVVVSIVRLNARSGAMVNEVALEEETRTPTNLCRVAQTPQFTDVYGSAQVLSQDVPAGTVVKAYSPRGDVVGCFVVSTAGDYGFMRIYGEDATATPPIPGMRDGELVEFRVSGALATATPKLYWQNDHSTHLVDLNAGTIDGQLVSLNPGWNLISFYVDPPVPTTARVLTYLSGLYDRVLSRTGVYVPSLPGFNTLAELHAKQGYYLRLSSTTSVDAYIEGTLVPVGTPLALDSGWNWIGYLPRVSMPVTTALQSIAGQYQLVLSLNQTYVPSLPQYSTLTAMEPGKGYLIHMTNPAALTYPEIRGSSTSTSADTESNGTCPAVPPTPAFTIVYGSVAINGVAAAGGTVVEVVTPRGDVAGCGVVTTDGLLPLTHVYGEDVTADPPIPGFRDGELIAFHANGFPVAAEPTIWNDDSLYHEVALSGEIQVLYLPMVARYE